MGKTVKLYKYVSLDYLEDVLKNSHLHLFNGESCNDPFEYLCSSKDNEYVALSLTNSYLKKLMWSFYGDSHKGVCLTIEIDNDLICPILYSSKKPNKDKSYEEFKKNVLITGKKNIPFKDNYKDLYYLFVKDKKWIDEKEYRAIFNINDKNIEHINNNYFLPVKITNMYIGVKCELDNKIISICEKNNITLKYVELDEKRYSLKIKKY